MSKKPIFDTGRMFNEPRGNTPAPTALIAEIAIGLWRIEQSMRQENNGQTQLDELRSFKHLQRMQARLTSMGVAVQDRTGQAYDPGMSVRVVATEERADTDRATIVESITPSVVLNDKLIHAAEIVIAVPAKSTTKDVPTP